MLEIEANGLTLKRIKTRTSSSDEAGIKRIISWEKLNATVK